MKKIISVGLLFAAASMNSFAHDAERLNGLEKEILELKLRLSKLETQTSHSVDLKNAITSNDGWKFQKNWRSLSAGMSPNEVRGLLGEPQQIKGGNTALWTYSNRGEVIFLDNILHQWREPKW